MDVSQEPPANIQGTKNGRLFAVRTPEVLSGALPAERLVALEGEELASEEVKDKRRLGKKMRAWNHEMGVSKNRGTPKWMIYNGKPY